MKIDLLDNKRVALLIHGTDISKMPNWHLSDLDAFYHNLPFWARAESDPVESLFSLPIKGIKQHLANFRDKNVGLYGEKLSDNSLLEMIKVKYMEYGYDILFYDQVANITKYFNCPPDKKVRITWQS